jgi:hypothetical protein
MALQTLANGTLGHFRRCRITDRRRQRQGTRERAPRNSGPREPSAPITIALRFA